MNNPHIYIYIHIYPYIYIYIYTYIPYEPLPLYSWSKINPEIHFSSYIIIIKYNLEQGQKKPGKWSIESHQMHHLFYSHLYVIQGFRWYNKSTGRDPSNRSHRQPHYGWGHRHRRTNHGTEPDRVAHHFRVSINKLTWYTYLSLNTTTVLLRSLVQIDNPHTIL